MEQISKQFAIVKDYGYTLALATNKYFVNINDANKYIKESNIDNAYVVHICFLDCLDLLKDTLRVREA